MIEPRLILVCNWPGCTASVLSGRLHYHGSAGDTAELTAAAEAMGWDTVPAVAVDDRTEGPWHYCPAHSREKVGRA